MLPSFVTVKRGTQSVRLVEVWKTNCLPAGLSGDQSNLLAGALCLLLKYNHMRTVRRMLPV